MRIFVMYDTIKEGEEMLLAWDPERSRMQGILKGTAEFKTVVKYDSPGIEFAEPKKRKSVRTSPVVTRVGKKNKNTLF